MARARRWLGGEAVPPRFEDLSVDFEDLDQAPRPYLDRSLSQDEEVALDPQQRLWRNNGYLILERFLPDALLDAYIKVRAALPDTGGWGPAPYLYHDEIKDLCLYRPLLEILEKLIGDRVILHLNLTGWVSTERDWHQDDYLNPPFVRGSYLAIWVALDTISPDCGPFEYVPGSHKWRVLSRSKVKAQLPVLQAAQRGMVGDEGHWASYSERMVATAAANYIARKDGKVAPFLGRKGDVLIWHGCLLHRGSRPLVPGKPRLALIAHYSGKTNRRDFSAQSTRTYEPTGGLYQHFDVPLSS